MPSVMPYSREAHIELGLKSADSMNELKRRSHIELGLRSADSMNELKRRSHIDIGRKEDVAETEPGAERGEMPSEDAIAGWILI